jgi:hypothetical protein
MYAFAVASMTRSVNPCSGREVIADPERNSCEAGNVRAAVAIGLSEVRALGPG